MQEVITDVHKKITMKDFAHSRPMPEYADVESQIYKMLEKHNVIFSTEVFNKHSSWDAKKMDIGEQILRYDRVYLNDENEIVAFHEFHSKNKSVLYF